MSAAGTVTGGTPALGGTSGGGEPASNGGFVNAGRAGAAGSGGASGGAAGQALGGSTSAGGSSAGGSSAGTPNLGGQGGLAGAAASPNGGAIENAGSSPVESCPTTATAKPGESQQSIMAGGAPRTFVRHIPPGYTGQKPVPVVIDFHPLGGTGSSWKGSTGWSALADQEGFVMLWPDGVGNSWNVGRCCSTAQSQNIDDVAFTKAIVENLASDVCIDRRRIYATGCSNGGGMAFKVACDASDVIAAVAPVDFDCVTGATAEPSCASCTPSRPISELQFRGTNDTAVPYDGGSGPRRTEFPGAEANFSEWKAINQCSGSPEPLADHASCQAYDTCAGGAETILCTVQNGTHCGSYQSFGIVNLAWQLFRKTTLP